MISRCLVSVPSTLPIPTSGTYAYQGNVTLLDRTGRVEAPDDGKLYLRLRDSSDSAIADVLTTTAGAALPASASSLFPSADGWRQLTAAAPGSYDFELAVADTATSTRGALEIAYRTEAETQRRRVVLALTATASVDLTAVTDALDALDTKIGTPVDTDLVTDIANMALTVTTIDGVLENTGGVVEKVGAIELAIGDGTNRYDTISTMLSLVFASTVLCAGKLAYGSHTTTLIKSPAFPSSSGIDYTGCRLLVRRASDGCADVREIQSTSTSFPRSATVTSAFGFTPNDGDWFAVLPPLA